MQLSTDNYKFTSWQEYFPEEDKVDLKKLCIHKSWKKLFTLLFQDERFNKLENYLTKCKCKPVNILPYPELVFNAFLLSIKKVKIIILGQDPYINIEKKIPQAMGLSFSVPIGIKTPSSLQNIYKNLLKYNHIKEIPNHGNLEHLVNQGVLLLNSSLTVQENISNSHELYWCWFTDEIIKYLANYNNNIIFILWGKNAINKLNLINNCKFIASSHPSGLSYNKPCGIYPAFASCDFAKDLPIKWD